MARSSLPKVKRLGKSVGEFCASYGVSRSTYETWRRLGVGPMEIQPIKGGRVLITQEAEDAWKAKHSNIAAVLGGAAE
jgi:hypothetical protein